TPSPLAGEGRGEGAGVRGLLQEELVGALLFAGGGGLLGRGGAVEEDLVERARLLTGRGQQPGRLVDALHDDAGRLREVLGRLAGSRLDHEVGPDGRRGLAAR